jgi:hypothetical protein
MILAEHAERALMLDSCFVVVMSKTGVGEDADSSTPVASEYFIHHMALAQHAEQIKFDMLALESQILFAADHPSSCLSPLAAG